MLSDSARSGDSASHNEPDPGSLDQGRLNRVSPAHDVCGLAAVFGPRRVALVGASDRAGSVGRLLWDNLADFPGEVLPVCPAATVGGRVAYADLRDVPGEVDLAVIATPAATVPDIMRAAAGKGVRAAVVLSAGFAETGAAGAALQRDAVAAAQAGGVRLVGPNCFGVQNADLPLNASIAAGTPRGGGGVSIVTQSGSYGMAVHTLGQDEGLRVAKVFAAGNKADITDAELLAYLRQDPETRVICLLLESITDARRFFAEACRTTPVKPVIAVVGGRTGAGQRAALSHTAALATDDAVRDAALRQAGVVRVRTGLQVLDAARALSGQPMPRGPRVAVVTNSGGTGVELADLLADEGLEVPELSLSLQSDLRALLPGYASARNPVDMTPAWRLFTTLYPATIERLARSGEVDVVMPVLLQRSASQEVAATVRDAVARLRADGVPVPVYVCWVAPRAADVHASLLQEAGVPCFPWPQRAAQVAGAAVRCGMRAGQQERGRPAARPAARRARPSRRLPMLADAAHPSTAPADAVPASTAPASTAPASDGLLAPDAARQLLAGAGIAVVETVLCGDTAAAVAAASRLGYPVVAKVAHPALTHKSDVGGVRLGLASADAVCSAAAELLALADGAAVLVQPQRQGIELVVGGVRDPEFGPVVMAGLGGVLVETRRDVQLAIAPVDEAQAAGLLRSLRGAAIFGGLRGSPPVDLGPVAALVATVSELMADNPEISELDLNPVLATATGCLAVDWRIRVTQQ
ncbi:MAG TPA: acetate--CoA ligase family protein [Streptosporangiaceae bacterium]|nr:acetate--CoA ligase family protein [Streptosporangiaceae bacterium]